MASKEAIVRRGGPARSRGLRGRVLGWYVFLLAIALALVSVLLFEGATLFQDRVAEQKLREELFDLEATLAARPAGQSLAEAVRLFLAHWPPEEEEALIVQLSGGPPAAAGPIGAEPAVLTAIERAPGLDSIESSLGDARVMTRRLLIDGRQVGVAASVHLNEDDRADLRRALAIVLAVALLAFVTASALAWVTVGRLLRPLKEMARTAGEISSGSDLTRRIEAAAHGSDEIGQLAQTFNRMLERVQRAFERERRFLSEASHELRTPITICRGHLDVLGPDPDPREVRESVEIVVDELDRMGRIVEDLTLLSRIEDPAFLRPRELRVEHLLADVGGKAAPLLDGRLEVESRPGEGVVRADSQRLTQALINLLQNAARYSDGAVTLRAVEESDGWRFEVVDTGEGLPPGTEEEFFRPFTRGRTAEGDRGLGLGLAIVRAVAEAHGGAAGVLNRPGEGATFWIRVPR